MPQAAANFIAWVMAQGKRRSHSHSSRQRKRSSARKVAAPGKALPLVIDQKPILKKALTQCRRLRTELHKKQKLLRRFEEEDQPRYQQWISATFGTQLTELRELRESVSDWEFVYEQMRCCEFWLPEKLGEVHAELMRRLKDGTLHAFEPPRPEEDEDLDEEDAGDFFDFDEFMEDAFKEFFDAADEDGDEWGPAEDDEPHAFRGARRRESNPEAAALKALYRTLAKRLHPDHAEMEEGLRERRWDELQAAYEAEDLGQCLKYTGYLSARTAEGRRPGLPPAGQNRKNALDFHARPCMNKAMPTKTISLEIDAYEKLRRAKRFPRESFSEVVRRVEIPGCGARGRDLLAREVFLDERDFEAIDALNANDAPPDIP